MQLTLGCLILCLTEDEILFIDGFCFNKSWWSKCWCNQASDLACFCIILASAVQVFLPLHCSKWDELWIQSDCWPGTMSNVPSQVVTCQCSAMSPSSHILASRVSFGAARWWTEPSLNLTLTHHSCPSCHFFILESTSHYIICSSCLKPMQRLSMTSTMNPFFSLAWHQSVPSTSGWGCDKMSISGKLGMRVMDD